MTSEKELTKDLLDSQDLVLITTAHTNIDYKFVADNSKVIFDTKNVSKNIKSNNIELL